MLKGLLVESGQNPASVLKDFFRSPGIVSLLVDSRWTPGRLQIQYQEFTWTPDGVHQDPWLSVTTSFGCPHCIIKMPTIFCELCMPTHFEDIGQVSIEKAKNCPAH